MKSIIKILVATSLSIFSFFAFTNAPTSSESNTKELLTARCWHNSNKAIRDLTYNYIYTFSDSTYTFTTVCNDTIMHEVKGYYYISAIPVYKYTINGTPWKNKMVEYEKIGAQKDGKYLILITHSMLYNSGIRKFTEHIKTIELKNIDDKKLIFDDMIDSEYNEIKRYNAITYEDYNSIVSNKSYSPKAKKYINILLR